MASGRPSTCNLVVKGVPIALVFLFLRFRASQRQGGQRTMLLATPAICIRAIAVGKALSLVLPFRFRPMHGERDLKMATGVDVEIPDGWSSMPSDHAVPFFALAAAF